MPRVLNSTTLGQLTHQRAAESTFVQNFRLSEGESKVNQTKADKKLEGTDKKLEAIQVDIKTLREGLTVSENSICVLE